MASAPPLTSPARPEGAEAKGSIGPRWFVGTLLALYFVFAALAGTQSPCGNDLGGVFLPSARFVVAGRPLDMYQVRVGTYPNANGPLGEVAIGGVLALGRALHLDQIAPTCAQSDNYPAPGDSIALRIWLSAIFAIFPFLIGRELMRLADRMMRPALSSWRRALVWSILLIMPAIWDSLIYYGHIEQVIALWLALLSVRWFGERRVALSGLALGLALLNRTAEIFVIIPLVLLLLRDQRWRHLATFVATMGATLAAGLGPFLLHDRSNTVYSLLTFRSQLGIGDGSFWTFFRDTPYAMQVQGLDSTVGIVGATIVTVIALWWGRVRADEPAFYGVVGLSVLWFALSIKAIWGYYFYDPQTWLLAWAVGQPMLTRRRAVTGEASPAPSAPLPAITTQVRWWAVISAPLITSTALGLTEGRIGLTDMPAPNPHLLRTEILLLSAATSLLLAATQVVMLVLIFRRPATNLEGGYAAEKSAVISPEMNLSSQRT